MTDAPTSSRRNCTESPAWLGVAAPTARRRRGALLTAGRRATPRCPLPLPRDRAGRRLQRRGAPAGDFSGKSTAARRSAAREKVRPREQSKDTAGEKKNITDGVRKCLPPTGDRAKNAVVVVIVGEGGGGDSGKSRCAYGGGRRGEDAKGRGSRDPSVRVSATRKPMSGGRGDSGVPEANRRSYLSRRPGAAGTCTASRPGPAARCALRRTRPSSAMGGERDGGVCVGTQYLFLLERWSGGGKQL